MNIVPLLLPGTLLVSWMAIAVGVYCLLSAKKQIIKSQRICENLARDLHVASNGAAGMGQRIILLEKKLAAMNDANVDCVEEHAVNIENVEFKDAYSNVSIQKNDINKNTNKTLSVFDQAKQLLRNGISERQVVKISGLSPDEVALMKMLVQSGMNGGCQKATKEIPSNYSMGKTNVFA